MTLGHRAILRQSYVSGLLNTEKNDYCADFKRWVSANDYVLQHVYSVKHFEFYVPNRFSYEHMLSYEISKASCSAFESIIGLQKIIKNPKSIAWATIQSYYAAYFSAHAVMRCFGFHTNYLEAGHITIINNQADFYGFPRVDSGAGTFSSQYDDNRGYITLKKETNTHEATWKSFNKCLTLLSSRILTAKGLSNEKSHLSSYIDGMVYELKRNGKFPNGNWLSSMRNEINYRYGQNVWYPYTSESISFDEIKRITDMWEKEEYLFSHSANTKNEMKDFILLNTKIINLCHNTLRDIIETSPQKNSIFKTFPKKFLDMIG